MKFSLLVSTVGRRNELRRFFDSLLTQRYQNLEVILVDQNCDESLKSIVNDYQQKLQLIYVRSQLGLSRGRNIALQYATGDIIAFPDDDCWYYADTLNRIHNFFLNQPSYAGLVVSINDATCSKVEEWKKPDLHREMGRYDLLDKAPSITIFLRRQVVREVGEFDEALGVGSGTIFLSAEETDYLIRAVSGGWKLAYAPTIKVGHPRFPEGEQGIVKIGNYAVGTGYVLRKQSYPWWSLFYGIWFPIIKALVKIVLGHGTQSFRLYYAILKGRIKGWRVYS